MVAHSPVGVVQDCNAGLVWLGPRVARSGLDVLNMLIFLIVSALFMLSTARDAAWRWN